MDDFYGVKIKLPINTEPPDDAEPQLYPPEPADEAESNEVNRPPSMTQDSAITPFQLDNIKSVLLYMDKLLEDLPEAKITEFANSDFFKTYKNLFKELGLV
jgi:hypothetical protein